MKIIFGIPKGKLFSIKEIDRIISSINKYKWDLIGRNTSYLMMQRYHNGDPFDNGRIFEKIYVLNEFLDCLNFFILTTKSRLLLSKQESVLSFEKRMDLSERLPKSYGDFYILQELFNEHMNKMLTITLDCGILAQKTNEFMAKNRMDEVREVDDFTLKLCTEFADRIKVQVSHLFELYKNMIEKASLDLSVLSMENLQFSSEPCILIAGEGWEDEIYCYKNENAEVV